MGAIRAVTFDFHNTLVEAPGWLELEIRTLPWAVLRALARDGALPAALPAALEAQCVALYQAVREEAKASGREVDAVTGVARVLAGLGWGDRVPPDALAAAVEVAERACLAAVSAVPGAPAAVAALQSRGLRLAVVSSAAYPPFVHWGLARVGLAGFFPVVATSAAVGYYKSDPRLYAWALDRLGVPPAAAVHVGDHARFDVAGAQAAGMRAVLFDRGPAALASSRPTDYTPDATITALAELPGVLARLDATLN